MQETKLNTPSCDVDNDMLSFPSRNGEPLIDETAEKMSPVNRLKVVDDTNVVKMENLLASLNNLKNVNTVDDFVNTEEAKTVESIFGSAWKQIFTKPGTQNELDVDYLISETETFKKNFEFQKDFRNAIENSGISLDKLLLYKDIDPSLTIQQQYDHMLINATRVLDIITNSKATSSVFNLCPAYERTPEEVFNLALRNYKYLKLNLDVRDPIIKNLLIENEALDNSETILNDLADDFVNVFKDIQQPLLLIPSKDYTMLQLEPRVLQTLIPSSLIDFSNSSEDAISTIVKTLDDNNKFKQYKEMLTIDLYQDKQNFFNLLSAKEKDAVTEEFYNFEKALLSLSNLKLDDELVLSFQDDGKFKKSKNEPKLKEANNAIDKILEIIKDNQEAKNAFSKLLNNIKTKVNIIFEGGNGFGNESLFRYLYFIADLDIGILNGRLIKQAALIDPKTDLYKLYQFDNVDDILTYYELELIRRLMNSTQASELAGDQCQTLLNAIEYYKTNNIEICQELSKYDENLEKIIGEKLNEIKCDEYEFLDLKKKMQKFGIELNDDGWPKNDNQMALFKKIFVSSYYGEILRLFNELDLSVYFSEREALLRFYEYKYEQARPVLEKVKQKTLRLVEMPNRETIIENEKQLSSIKVTLRKSESQLYKNLKETYNDDMPSLQTIIDTANSLIESAAENDRARLYEECYEYIKQLVSDAKQLSSIKVTLPESESQLYKNLKETYNDDMLSLQTIIYTANSLIKNAAESDRARLYEECYEYIKQLVQNGKALQIRSVQHQRVSNLVNDLQKVKDEAQQEARSQLSSIKVTLPESESQLYKNLKETYKYDDMLSLQTIIDTANSLIKNAAENDRDLLCEECKRYVDTIILQNKASINDDMAKQFFIKNQGGGKKLLAN